MRNNGALFTKTETAVSTLDQVFGQFVETMKADPLIGDDIASRIKAIIDAGVIINQKALEGTLFPYKRQRTMLRGEEVHIEEFRGIRKLDITFDSANFGICGPNGTGKSGVV